MTKPGSVRPGVAPLALLMILVITAAWWALALWPAGAVEPAWLVRTRAACFGSAPGGLPDAGGWILLIGEPIGMVGILMAVWGKALREELRRMRADPWWRLAMMGVGALSLAGLVAVGQRVAFVAGIGAPTSPTSIGVPTAMDLDVTSLVLTDQQSRRISLSEFRGRSVLLTFAFGHCTTVCPTLVHDVLAARSAAGRADVPLLVISVDPWRDTPAQLASIAAAWQLGPLDRVLSGSVAEVEHVLTVLGVGRRRDDRTGDIDHPGTVMLMNHRGYIRWRLDGGWGRVRELLTALPPSIGGSGGPES